MSTTAVAAVARAGPGLGAGRGPDTEFLFPATLPHITHTRAQHLQCPDPRFASSYLILSSSVVMPMSMLYISRTLSGRCLGGEGGVCGVPPFSGAGAGAGPGLGATVMGAGAGTEAGTGAGTGKGSVRLFMISSFMFLSSRMSLHILQQSGG